MGTLIKTMIAMALAVFVAGCSTSGGNLHAAMARLKPLAPAVAANMDKLADDAHKTFARSLEATQAADDAEILAKTAPDDVKARYKLREAARAEVNAWNAYVPHRERFVQAVNTTTHQGYDVGKYHDQAAELLQMDAPIFTKVSNRRS